MRQKIEVVIAKIVAFGLIAVILFLLIRSYYDNKRFDNYGLTTATITYYNTRGRSTYFTYEYVVDGVKYIYEDGGVGGIPKLNVGETYQLKYSKEDPRYSKINLSILIYEK
jgi:hypothetical protein